MRKYAVKRTDSEDTYHYTAAYVQVEDGHLIFYDEDDSAVATVPLEGGVEFEEIDGDAE
jgi:hypothetical protein